MKKFILSFFAMLLGIASVHADEYSFTFEAKQFSANGTIALGTVDWTLAGDSDYCGYDSQYGKGHHPSEKPSSHVAPRVACKSLASACHRQRSSTPNTQHRH